MQRSLSSAMKLLATTLLASCVLSTDAKNLRASRILQTTVTESFDVNLTVALHFVDDLTATALETKDKANAVVQHFCNKVQEQASGQQVASAAEEVDVSISTAGSVNECTVLDTVRAYDTGGQLLGAGFFTMEVHFKQTVYTASAEVLTLDTVTGLVENGYNRGRGGRVKFRNILQESNAFENLLDVDILDELGAFVEAPSQAPTTATASPTKEATVPPTMAPSSVPTVIPSNEPSLSPSLIPSFIPSASPSTTSPSPEPSVIPTESPSLAPSVYKMAGIAPTLSNVQPSSPPSSAPSALGAAAATSSNTPPYVIAAIVLGSWAILMACCFSIFLCRKNNKENDEVQLLHNGRPAEDSTPPLRGTNQENASQNLSTLPIVPNVVLADDDHRSLANTTLGEQTAGRKPPKKKRLVDTGISICSFEDESLYTSPIGIIPRIQPGRRIDEDEYDEKKRKSTASSPTLGVSSAFVSDIFFPSDTGSSSQESWSMPQSPVAAKIGGLVAAELGPVAGDHPEALPSEQGSQYTESRDDMDGMNGNSPWPTQHLSPRSSQSSLFSSLHSLDTLKAQNVATTIALSAYQMASEEQHTVDAPGTYERSGSSSLLIMRKKLEDDSCASEKDAAAKTPLKLLETHKEESAAAVTNEQSPMQMLEDEDNKTDVSPIDLQDSDSAFELRPSSSGERPPRIKTHPWQTGITPRTPTDVPPVGRTASRSVSPYKTRYLEGLQSPAAQLELEKTVSSGSPRTPSPLGKDTRREHVSLPGDSSLKPKTVTPPSDLLPSMYNVRQGDGARQNAIESPPPAPLTEGDVSILTTSSSGTSADDNPWLFESVARALGPRSTSADMESLSGKSVKSTKSGKSWRSHRSSKSLGNRQRRKRRKGGSIGSRGSQRTSFSFGSPSDYKSSSDFSLAPRSLENDLKRLEQQLASLNSTDPKRQQDRVPRSPPGLTGASSSVTASDMSSRRKVSTKQKIIVVAPPGKLGVVLANRHNGTGTVVSELRGSSPLRGALFPGDKLLAVDEKDVTGMNVSQITSFMTKRGTRERRLTVLTSSKARARAAKYAFPPAGSTTASESEGSP